MKVLFICGSLEEGKDGVGDYTRLLAQECQHVGLFTTIVAINDSYIEKIEKHKEKHITYYRFPKQIKWNEKKKELSKILNENDPYDWVSVQFVSYAFNSFGIILNVLNFFSLIKNLKVHVMMHELWIGEERGAPFKQKLLGRIQKYFIIRFLNMLAYKVISSSVSLYGKMLSQAGIRNFILPLFSNIQNNITASEEYIVQVPASIRKDRNNCLIGCFFGSIYFDNSDFDVFFVELEKYKLLSGKRIIISSLGNMNYGRKFWDELVEKYKDIEFLEFGQKEASFISYWLSSYVDMGIVSTPAIIAGKSGSYMAFLEHGIPVYCKKNDYSFNFDITEDIIDKNIIQVDKEFKFEPLHHFEPVCQLKLTTQKFIQALENFKE